MATTNQWVAPNTIASALTTELNSLATATYSAVSAAIDNEAGLFLYLDAELLLASLTPTGSPSCSVFMVRSIDNGTTFEDTPTAAAPVLGQLLCTFDLNTTASAKRRVAVNLLIPPLQFKLVLLNQSGVTLASSGNTVRVRRHNEQSV